MSEVNYFLKVLAVEGYPNPDLQSIAALMGYDNQDFLLDLKEEIGEQGVLDFCDKAIEKLTGDKGLRVDLDGPNGDEYVYIHIYPIYYSEDEDVNSIISNHGWGDSRVLGTNEEGEEEYMTIQQVIDNTDMGGWSELDELLDHIKDRANNIVYKNCGFHIWWE